jgi:hypothetical protein
MNLTQFKEKLQSKKYRDVILVAAILVATFLVFTAGMEVGYMKASFHYRLADNYNRGFGPNSKDHPMMGLVPPNDVTSAHGANGKIISINLPLVVVADFDHTEKTVRITDDTTTRKMRDTISANDLEVGSYVLVIGTPNDNAEIEAKFIRVMPPPEHMVPALPISQ